MGRGRARPAREGLLNLHQFLLRMDLMPQFPLTEVTRAVQVDEAGRETIIQTLKPARWAKRDAARYWQIAGDAGRQGHRVAIKCAEPGTHPPVPVDSELHRCENRGHSWASAW